MKLQILVVDGSLTTRMDLRSALGAAGFLVTACETKALALKVLESRAFSLVILSMSPANPGADADADADAIEILKQIRSAEPPSHTPVILLAPLADVYDRLRPLSIGADEYLGKPYDTAYLIQRARELMSQSVAPSSPTPERTRRILAVDDSPTSLDAVARVLRDEGYDVLLARSGEEALVVLASEQVHGVVMDLLMPGMGGMEAARQIRAAEPTRLLPIVMLTGQENAQDRHLGAKVGVDEFVIKSPELSTLKVQLRGVLRRRRQAELPRVALPEIEDIEEAPPSSVRWTVAPGSLFEKVIAVSGLARAIAPSTIGRACRRAGVDARSMAPAELRRALPHIEETLRVFCAGDERRRRLEAISALADD